MLGLRPKLLLAADFLGAAGGYLQLVVVLSTPTGLSQNMIGGGYSLKQVFVECAAAVLIRMILDRQPLIRQLDFTGRSCGRYP